MVDVVEDRQQATLFLEPNAQAQLQISISSTLVCGSNAAGEPLPLHIMFSSSAQSEDNYSVSAEWMFDLSRVFIQFGHEASQSFLQPLQ
jgi:hypothetical protein